MRIQMRVVHTADPLGACHGERVLAGTPSETQSGNRLADTASLPRGAGHSRPQARLPTAADLHGWRGDIRAPPVRADGACPCRRAGDGAALATNLRIRTTDHPLGDRVGGHSLGCAPVPDRLRSMAAADSCQVLTVAGGMNVATRRPGDPLPGRLPPFLCNDQPRRTR